MDYKLKQFGKRLEILNESTAWVLDNAKMFVINAFCSEDAQRSP